MGIYVYKAIVTGAKVRLFNADSNFIETPPHPPPQKKILIRSRFLVTWIHSHKKYGVTTKQTTNLSSCRPVLHGGATIPCFHFSEQRFQNVVFRYKEMENNTLLAIFSLFFSFTTRIMGNVVH